MALLNLNFTFSPQGQNDFMQDWMLVREQYLAEVLETSAPSDSPTSPKCSRCHADALYRCEDCHFCPAYCAECCRTAHEIAPWHRVGRWQGTFFRRDMRWQQHVELNLHFGHGGGMCPVYMTGDAVRPGGGDEPWTDDEDGDEEGLGAAGLSTGLPPEDLKVTKITDSWDNPVLTVVHTNGIHFIQAKFCQCSTRRPQDRQVLAAGLYPASQRQVRTVFTNHVLNDCLMSRLECKATTSNFFTKLRRQTSQAFPSMVPVCRYTGLRCLDIYIR